MDIYEVEFTKLKVISSKSEICNVARGSARNNQMRLKKHGSELGWTFRVGFGNVDKMSG